MNLFVFIKLMQNVLKVTAWLESKSCLTNTDVEDITLNTLPRYEQVHRLISKLRMKPDAAFNQFVIALVSSKQLELAKRLDPDAGKSIIIFPCVQKIVRLS